MSCKYDDFHDTIQTKIAEAECDFAQADKVGYSEEKARCWGRIQAFNEALYVYRDLPIIEKCNDVKDEPPF